MGPDAPPRRPVPRPAIWSVYLALGAAADLPLRLRAAVRRLRAGHERARPLAGHRDPRRAADLPAAVARAVDLVRDRLRALLPRRRLHLQLPAAPGQGGAVPVPRRRLLRRGLPGAHGRPVHARPAPEPAFRPRRRHRLADHHARPVAAVVGVPDRPVPARHRAHADRQGLLDRLPVRRHPAARGGDPPRRRHGQAADVVLPARLERRRPAGHGLRLRPRAAQRHVRQRRAARRRLDQLLPAVGRCGPAPDDARARPCRAGEGRRAWAASAWRC